jgi:ubiquinone/menaquinone biosynthesis C-methylase UbiE
MDCLSKEVSCSYIKALALKNDLDNFLNIIKKQRVPIFNSLRKNCNFKGEILEVGAGSCWLSALISKVPAVRKVYALDISKDLLEMVGADIVCRMNGNKKKIEFVNSDFNNLPFENNKFDIVICDASLHHALDLDF